MGTSWHHVHLTAVLLASLTAAGCSSSTHEASPAATSAPATSSAPITPAAGSSPAPSTTTATATATATSTAPAGNGAPSTIGSGAGGDVTPSGTSTCSASQLQPVLSEAQGMGGGQIRGLVEIRNTGPTCTVRGFPAVEFLAQDGTVMPSYDARSRTSATPVTLPANQPPVPPYGARAYAYLQVLGTNLTTAMQPCPTSRQEQPVTLRVVLPGSLSYDVRNNASGSAFTSCDGRVQVSPITLGA